MKKASIFIALVFMAIGVQSQIIDSMFVIDRDSSYTYLEIGDREPTFYYWDTNWWDYYYLNYPEARSLPISWVQWNINNRQYKGEVARYCYTDTALRVIGVAAAMSMNIRYDSISEDDVHKYLEDGYFCLYEVDSNTGEMVKLASKSWKGFRPRYKMATSISNSVWYPIMFSDPPKFTSVYEVYFDSAITVHDSFYVSTTDNNVRTSDWTVISSLASVHAISYDGHDPVTGSNVVHHPEFYPKPNHYKRKLHIMPPPEGDDKYFETDTLWHTYDILRKPTGRSFIVDPVVWDYFMFIFPIIDTTGLYLRQPCTTTTGFRNVSIDSCTVAMEWNLDGSSERYEVAVSRIGRTPEEGTVVQCDTNYAVVRTEPWDTTAQWYSAWVRCICAAGHRSEWSSPVTFNVHCSPGAGPEDPVGISVAVDRASRLQPNPASGSVRVESSYRIAEVELFSLDGRSLQRRAVDATGTTLDISQLPSGTYIVRIATTSGTAYKKLVVK